MDTLKMAAGEKFPMMGWNAVSGDRIVPANGSGWRLLVIYQGKHCASLPMHRANHVFVQNRPLALTEFA
jgi:hypothetical protein